MMNIREYFRTLADEIGFEEAYEEETRVYEMEDEDFERWLTDHDIDTTATETVMGEDILVITLWSWDMCGD